MKGHFRYVASVLAILAAGWAVAAEDEGDQAPADQPAAQEAAPATSVKPVAPPAELVAQITQDVQSDPDRARKLFEASQALGDEPALAVGMLEKSVEFGLKAPRREEDFQQVERTIALLMEKAPDRRGVYRQWRIELYRRWVRASEEPQKARLAVRLTRMLLSEGYHQESREHWAEALGAYREALALASAFKVREQPEIAKAYQRASHFAKAQARAEGYEKILKDQPANTNVRMELVKTLVVDLDSPERAKAYLNDELGPVWRTYVPLAAEPIQQLQEGPCKELGDWYYKELAKSAVVYSRAAMCARAKAYYERYLSLHNAQDVAGVAVKIALAEVDKQLAELGVERIRIREPERPQPPTVASQQNQQGQGDNKSSSDNSRRYYEDRARRMIDYWRHRR